MNKLLQALDGKIFWAVSIPLIAIIVFGFVCPDAFGSGASAVLNFILEYFNWFILLSCLIIDIVLVIICLHPFGKKKIGGPDAKPEFSFMTWFALSLCASIGISIMFAGVRDPILWFNTVFPQWTGVDPLTNRAALASVAQSTLHWSVFYYGIQIIWGVPVLYLANKGLPIRPSTALYPVIKGKIFGWQGTAWDAFAVIAVIGGIATSFGFGAVQFFAGSSYSIGLESSTIGYLILIVIVTICYCVSSAKGIKKGMARLSHFNMWLYIALMVFLLFVGPTYHLLELFMGGLGDILQNFFPTVLNADFLGTEGHMGAGWTGYFYIWALVYGPVGGIFFARIAKGRTFRQYLLVNMIAPALFCLMWFSLWGGTAMWQDTYAGAGIAAAIAEKGQEVATFAFLDSLPLAGITTIITLICLLIGFITMTDSYSWTIACLTTKSTHTEAILPVKLFWGAVIGGLTLICLLVVGDVGMNAIQSTCVAFGLPVFIVGYVMLKGIFNIMNGKTDAYLETEAGKKDIETAAKSEHANI